MKLAKKQMRWSDINKKLILGVGIADRQAKLITETNAAFKKIEYAATRQLGGFGDSNLISQLQSGELLPDEVFGWSTKTILLMLSALLLLKVKKLQSA